MNYQILETHCVYNENGKPKEVAVLWQDGDGVRATYVNDQPTRCYKFILPNDVIDADFFQEVAAYGHYITDKQRKKYFPGKREWTR